MSSKTIQYLTPNNTIETLIFAPIISVINEFGIKFNTTNHKINNYFNNCLSQETKEYITDELDPIELDAVFILHMSNNIRSPCVIYNKKLSKLDFHSTTCNLSDLLYYCTCSQHSKTSKTPKTPKTHHIILNKYPLIKVNNIKVYNYKKIQELLLFNKLENSNYWLPKDVCFQLMLFIEQLLINSYFIQ